MPEDFFIKEIPKFKNPEEELAFLRRKVAEREGQSGQVGIETGPERAVEDVLIEYKSAEPEEVLEKKYILKEGEAERIVLNLTAEPHDQKIEELLGLLLEKGIKNTLSLLRQIGNPHLDDDFHRFLVQYIRSVGKVPDLRGKTPLFRALRMKLYEITLPEKKQGETQTFKELISVMEQFYSGMQSVADGRGGAGQDCFTIEIALPESGKEVTFYAAVPVLKGDLFEKHLLGSYPLAKFREVADDYNVFNFGGASIGASAGLSSSEVFPLKTWDKFENDPLNIILNVFSKLEEKGEGAAVQLVIKPSGEKFIQRYTHILDDVKRGISVKKALKSLSFSHGLVAAVKDLVSGPPGGGKNKKEEEKKVDEKAVENINEKMKSTITAVNLRIIASAATEERAGAVLSDLKSAFNQFSEAGGNSLDFKKTESQNKLSSLFHNFSYRLFSEEDGFPLNLKEISTIIHFPAAVIGAPHLRQAKAGSAPAPLAMGKEGILLGVNYYHGQETKIFFKPEDRVRHFYAVGQTGTGKTVLLKNMIVQDIKNGEGVCFIDPHGSDIQDILGLIPRERFDDVIYFDPAYAARPMALNMLEYDERFPQQKTFVVDELFNIFRKLYGAVPESMGPMFEQYFRNSTMLVIEDPESGNTLLDVSRVLADQRFRELKLSHCRNPVVVQFWREIASKAGGESSLANIVPYITSKFDVFLANEVMRPIIAQPKSAFNFRKIMDEKKILLVNLSKGKLGDINANLIGLILVGKILMAALSRVDMIGTGQRVNDFYLYIDEFQNVTTDSISQILAEARKYRLSLNIAHQFIAQLEEKIKNAVFGNVGSMTAFRVGFDDAKYLESQFEPVFSASDLIKIDNYNAYLRLLIDGQPSRPFNITTIPPQPGEAGLAEKIKELSYLKHGRPREEVEAEIMAKYQKE